MSTDTLSPAVEPIRPFLSISNSGTLTLLTLETPVESPDQISARAAVFSASTAAAKAERRQSVKAD